GDVPAQPDRSLAQGRGSAALAPGALEAAPRPPGAPERFAPGRARVGAGKDAAHAARSAPRRRRLRPETVGGEVARRPVASAARLRRLGIARRPPAVPGAGRGRAGARVRLKLVPLGTSAGRPTLLRGASALAVATDGAWVLCDCGEGAQIAALRAGLSLSRLDAVLITHLHGDHFNGLPGLLGTLGLEGRERPLTVAGPRGIATLLETLARAGALGIGGLPVQIVELDGDGGVVPLSQDDDGFRVTALQLAHRVPTYGYRLSLPDRPGALDVDAALAAGVPRGPLVAGREEGR